MSEPLFVDTNVFVYAHDLREASKRLLARQWLEHLWRNQLGRTSTQVLSEYYTTITRKLRPGVPPQDAWTAVSALLVWEPQALDSELLLRAREIEQRYRLAWWDALVVAAAELQGCAVLLTEDLQDGGTFGAVTVRNPFTAAVADVHAAYTAPRVSTRRFRPRGRPKQQVA
jgi:predicted nucleic acid-binding protein